MMPMSCHSKSLIYKSVLGALSIALGTILSNNVDHEYLSPICFSVGILIVIAFDLGLITRAVPSGKSTEECFIVGLANLVTAALAGFLLADMGDFPQEITCSLTGAVATGIIIGLVSISNKVKSRYSVLITMILMFSFVYLKLPHCVVYAFYCGAARALYGTSNWLNMCSVVAGNVVGGLIVRFCYQAWNKYELQNTK